MYLFLIYVSFQKSFVMSKSCETLKCQVSENFMGHRSLLVSLSRDFPLKRKVKVKWLL